MAEEIERQNKRVPTEAVTVHPDDYRPSWRFPAIKTWAVKFWSGRKEEVKNILSYLGRYGETNRQNTGFLGQCKNSV